MTIIARITRDWYLPRSGGRHRSPQRALRRPPTAPDGHVGKHRRHP